MEPRNNRLYEAVNNYIYYILIVVLSLLAAFFLPMLGSQIEGGFQWPDTGAAWCVWIITKCTSAVINVLLLTCFVRQAKLNIKNDPNYLKAVQILNEVKIKAEKQPRSPSKYMGAMYTKKGTMIFISSVLGTFALTQAILTFDWVALLTYGFVVIMGVVFGVMQMKRTEIYWTEEFLLYAMKVAQEAKDDNLQQ